MSVISKELFYSRIGAEFKCHHIHIWDENCWRAYAFCAHQIFIGGLKFFLPIYIIKAILRRKKLKQKEFLKKTVLEEFRSALYAVTLGLPIFIANYFSKLTGRIHYYNLGLVAGFFSGFGLLIETRENKMLDTLIFFNLLVEAAFKNMHRFDILKLNRTKETIIFMLVSSLLMHILQNRQKDYKFTNFWFYMPELYGRSEKIPKKRGTLGENGCSKHEGKCRAFALEGLQKYFFLGYGFSIIKKIIPRMFLAFKNPKLLYSLIINKENARFGTFIGAYVAIYRYVSCYLLSNHLIKTELIGAIAGFLSGCMYSVSPNIQVISVGITTLFQVGFNRYLQEFKVKNKEIPQLLIYIISHSLLLHNAIMAKETCPSYYFNMLDVATNNLYVEFLQYFRFLLFCCSRFPEIYNSFVVKHILN
ncbi:transmembrane protein 135-like isoform X2 [Euwallacea similis]|uniref:transmembrane protein 135-like isoform X2 n=1 Tax=Euwallacea similis TaxID=1736056 RepID=UPI00344BD67B